MWYSRVCLVENLIAKFLAILSIHLPRQDDFLAQNSAVSSHLLENDPYDSMNISSLAQLTGASPIKNLITPT